MNNHTPKIRFARTRSLWFGITLPYKSVRLVFTNSSLFLWSVLPIVLTFVLYVYGISVLQEYVIGLFQSYITNWGFGPESFLGKTLMFFTKIFLWVIAALTFAFASSIVASPFNDVLAEKSEKFGCPPLPPVTDKSFKQFVRLIGIDLIKTVATAFAAILAVLFSWVPILNLVAFVIAFLLLTFQFISYPQTRRGIGLRKGSKFLWDHMYSSIGFGATLAFLFAIPFFSSFILPIAVVGGTLLAARAPGSPQIAALK